MTLHGRTRVAPTPGAGGGVYRGAGDFRPAWWLPGAHLQTVWGRLTRGRSHAGMARETLRTPDGDDLVVDHRPGRAGTPLLLVLHGLEGSSASVYVQGLVALAAARGWRAAAMNFRSCARDPIAPARTLPNRRPRLYHSGETTDLDFLVSVLAGREPGTPLYAAGVSLGGNVLLKWLGEHPGQSLVRAAATISVPYDLAAGARHLERGLGRLYTTGLLRTLREKAIDTARRFPEAAAKIDIARARRSRTFREFDDAATAPLHGFAGVDDYYARSSSLAYLPNIDTPTLCLSAADDPFLPEEAVARARRAAAASVRFEVTSRGGHAGFVAGPLPWKSAFWAEELALEWLAVR